MLFKKLWNTSKSLISHDNVRKTFMALGAFYGVLEYCLKHLIQSLKKNLAPHRLIPIRRRYIMTRANKPRLRYVAMGVACCMAFATATLSTQASLAIPLLDGQKFTKKAPHKTLMAKAETMPLLPPQATPLQLHVRHGRALGLQPFSFQLN